MASRGSAGRVTEYGHSDGFHYILTNMKLIHEYCVPQTSLYIPTPGVSMVKISITLWDRRQSRKYSFEPIPAQPPCPEETEDKLSESTV